MVEQTGSLIRRALVERHIEIRSRGKVRRVTLSRTWQVATILMAVLLVAGTVRLAAGYVNAHRRMAHKEAEVQKAEASKNDLNSLVEQLQQRLEQADQDMAEVRERLANVAAQNAALRGALASTDSRLRGLDAMQNDLLAERDHAQEQLQGAEAALTAKSAELAHMGRGLDATKSDLEETEQQRSELGVRLHRLEAELQDATNQSVQYKTSWEAAQRKLQALAEEREKVVAERDGLLGRLAVLQQPLLQERGRLGKAAADSPRGDAALQALSLPKSPGGLGGFIADEGRLGWTEVTALLSSAGVDIDKLAARFGAVPPSQGGPFVALGGIKQAKGDNEALQKALKTLPLAAPLAHYQLESRFGPRVDPFNRRPSFHPGLDLAAPFKSPVFNTAPGVVVFAGLRSDYGKVVEVDHGSGIVTRYAHLHRITVALGQHLGAREQIGLLGSTGRSSGPHVHYEVVVNGTPQDPEKFLQAGRSIVQVSQQQ